MMTTQHSTTLTRAPTKRPRRFNPLELPFDALLTHQRWIAGPGAGKSRGIARGPVWQHFYLGLPIICLDPTGAIVSNMIDKISYYPPHIQEKLWDRFIYVDCAATDYVVPMPLYYRQRPDDTLFTIASRFLQVIKLSDPALTDASIEGFNALYEIGIYAGMIIAALNENSQITSQITEVADLVNHPERWKHLFKQALEAYPELHSAVSYFQTYMSITNPTIRARQSKSFLNKLVPILSDPAMLATFATSKGRIDFDEVVKKRQAVFFDFRDVTDSEARQFLMLWVFRQVYQFLLSRSIAGREAPVLFVLDEISNLQGGSTENPILAHDISQLTSAYARNYGVKLVYAHQNLSQLDPRIHTPLAQMGTQVIGAVQPPDDAYELARQIYRYDPYKVKKTEPIYANTYSVTETEGESWQSPFSGAGWQKSTTTTKTYPEKIDKKTVEFTPEEQLLMAADLIRTIPKFHFLVRPALTEGDVTAKVKLMSIERIDQGMYPDEDLVAQARAGLRKKWGYPVKSLLSDITNRLKQPLTASVILPDNAQERDLPAKENKTEKQEDTPRHDEFAEQIPRTPEIAEALKTRQIATD